jgi:hypothetical protein
MWAGREGTTEQNFLFMFGDSLWNTGQQGSEYTATIRLFSQRDIFDYIKRGDATVKIWKFNDILLEQVTQFRQGLL